MSVVDIKRSSRKKKGKFKFRLDGESQIWTLPYLQHLDRKHLAKLRWAALQVVDKKGRQKKNISPHTVIKIAQLQREILECYCPGLYDSLSDEELKFLMEAWNEASSAKLGESSPSST